tara:strand:+ start:639 stop:1745 length:1107 start_codon:yes stop_codon:yes gene_type:complete
VFSLFLLFLLVGFIIHLLVRHFFKNRDFVDSPDGVKKQHEVAVPISGGLSFGLSYSLFIFICLLLFYFNLDSFFNIQVPNERYGSDFPFFSFVILLLISLVLLSICLIDDLVSLPVWIRLFTQISCSILFIQLGDVSLINLGALLGESEIILHEYIAFIFTIFCIVGVINAFNWIDGIDGFFSSQVLLALIGMIVLIGEISIIFPLFLSAMLPYILMNLGLFGKKFKVFIGDHGAMMIGFLFSGSFVLLSQEPEIRPVDTLWCIGLVLLNAFTVIWKRLIKGISIFSSDREHIHHYFLDLGYSTRETLFIVSFFSLIIFSIGITFSILEISESISFFTAIGIFLFWNLFSKSIYKKLKTRQESLQSSR